MAQKAALTCIRRYARARCNNCSITVEYQPKETRTNNRLTEVRERKPTSSSLSFCYSSANIIRNPNAEETLKLLYLTEPFSYMKKTWQQFGDDITASKKSNKLSPNRSLHSLETFIDSSDVFRARGRLSQAPLIIDE